MSSIDLSCRMLCASASAYLIKPDSKPGQYDPSVGADSGAKRQYDAVGYAADPIIVSDGIDAVLVGRTASELIVAFRGTLPPTWNASSILDWLNDIILAEPESNIELPGKVHSGFLRSLITVAEQTKAAIEQLNADNLPIYVTGHSKGGGMAPIAAVYLRNVYQITAQNVITFAGPKPGDEDFAKTYDELFPGDIRYENHLDLVPLLPPSKGFDEAASKLLGDAWPELAHLLSEAADWNYATVGTLRYIESSGSVIDDFPGLIDIRIAELLEKLATFDITAIGNAHHASCCFGYMNGACQGSVCDC